MNISRKDFFKKSFLSLGEAVYAVSDALKSPAAAAPPELPNPELYDPVPREDLVAVAHNERCLAKNSGCFSCVERCEPGAIKLVPGVGIRINPQICTGCGTCEYVCPVAPKAVAMNPRQKE